MLPQCPFNAADSLYVGLSIIVIQVGAQISGITGTTTTFTKAAHGLKKDQALEFISGTNAAPLATEKVYYVAAVPSADTFQLSETYQGAPLSLTVAASAVTLQGLVVVESKELDGDIDQEVKRLYRPSPKGVQYPVRSVLSKQGESWKYKIDTPKTLLDIFDGALVGRVETKARIWAPDVSDATGKCALVSERFSATVFRDGGLKFGGEDFSIASLQLDSNKQGAVIWTRDATV